MSAAPEPNRDALGASSAGGLATLPDGHQVRHYVDSDGWTRWSLYVPGGRAAGDHHAADDALLAAYLAGAVS